MTPLNTIIEEEKKEFDEKFKDLSEYVPAYWGEPDENGNSTAHSSRTIDRKSNVKAFLTTAMQRAYEAGAEAERERIVKWANDNAKELSDPYPFASTYTYSDFVNVYDLEKFIAPTNTDKQTEV